MIVDGIFIPFGWSKIVSNETTIEKYFRPRPAVVVSPNEIHSKWAVWLCPLFHEPRGKDWESVLKLSNGRQSAAWVGLTRNVPLDPADPDPLKLDKQMTLDEIGQFKAAFRNLFDGNIRDKTAPLPGAIVKDAATETVALVLESCRLGGRFGTILLTCYEVCLSEALADEDLANFGVFRVRPNSGRDLRTFDSVLLAPISASAIAQIDTALPTDFERVRGAVLDAVISS